MSGRDLYDFLVDQLSGFTQEEKLNAASNAINDCYHMLSSNGDKRKALQLCDMMFAMVACNDGKISVREHDLYKRIFRECSYDDFFNVMALYNKQQYRDEIGDVFRFSNDRDFSLRFIQSAVTIACCDNDIHINEEGLIVSLCDIYTYRFIND